MILRTLRPDFRIIARLLPLPREQAEKRIVNLALNEMGFMNIKKRKRIIVWEGKLAYAWRQLNDAKSRAIQNQHREEHKLAIEELRKEFGDEMDLNNFLQRVGELRSAYRMSLEK